MKIRFLKTVAVDMENPRINDVWVKTFNRWDELKIEEAFQSGNLATLKTYDGDFLLGLPTDAFEKLAEEKKLVSL